MAGILDQLVFSFSNMVVTVVVARAVTASEFGAFALAMAVYLLFTVCVRGVSSEVLTARYSTAKLADWRSSAEASTGAAAALGLAAGAVLLPVALVVPSGPTGPSATFLALAVSLPGLALQDALRFAALAKGAPGHALVNDLSQLVIQVLAILLLIRLGDATPSAIVLAWGLSAYAAAAISVGTLKLIPRVGRTFWWFKANGDLAFRFGIDNFINQGSGQSTSFLLAFISGLRDVGTLRAAQTAFRPTAILGLGVGVALVPELARSVATSRRQLMRDVRVLSWALAGASASWAALLLLTPPDVGALFLGDSWDGAVPLLGWLAIAQVANGFRFGPEAGLRAMQAGNRTLIARSIVSCLSVGALLIGTLLGGVLGLAIASAIVRPIEALVWWTIYRLTAARLTHE